MSNKTATFVKNLGWRGDARLYKLSEPYALEDYEGETTNIDYVIVSGINNEFGIETFIFPAKEDGEAISMGELEGSFKGAIDHAMALENFGYPLV
jgi:hypothetical protein